MKPYEMSARHNVRMAWRAMGKAREARAAAMMGEQPWFNRTMLQYSQDMVRAARTQMRLALMYRQMNEVL